MFSGVKEFFPWHSRIFIEALLDTPRNPLRRYISWQGEQSRAAAKAARRQGQPQGKHKRYIDANNGLARGDLYSGEELSSRKARAKGFLLSTSALFLNIVEINQLSLQALRGPRASSFYHGGENVRQRGGQSGPGVSGGEERDRGRRGGWKERLQAGVRAVARKLCAHTARLWNMHWLLKIRDGLLLRDSDTELKGSLAVAAAAAATNVAAASAATAAEERVYERLKDCSSGALRG